MRAHRPGCGLLIAMRLSTDRILVSHAGTLPRPDNVAKLFNDGPDDEFTGVLPGAVKEVVQRQANLGIDIVNDGEFSKSTGARRLNNSNARKPTNSGPPTSNDNAANRNAMPAS